MDKVIVVINVGKTGHHDTISKFSKLTLSNVYLSLTSQDVALANAL